MGTKIIFLLSMGIFGTFFYTISQTRTTRILLLLLPCMVTIIFLGASSTHIIKKRKSKRSLQKIFKRHGLLLARIFLLMGTGSSLDFFGIAYTQVIIILTSINIILRCASHFSQYDDGKYIFHITTILGFLSIGGTLFFQDFPLGITIGYFISLVPVYFAILSFLVFVIGTRKPPSQRLQTTTWLFFHFTIIIGLLGTPKDISLFMIIVCQAYIMIVYYSTYYFLKIYHPPETLPGPQEITAEQILAGQKIYQPGHYSQQHFLQTLFVRYKNFLDAIRPGQKLLLYFGNVLLVIGAIVLYVLHFDSSTQVISDQLLYRICIAFFFINFLIIKKDNDGLPKIHRIIAFSVINFAVFVNAIYVGNEQRGLILLITTLRNYGNAIVISQSHRIFPAHFFSYEDYYYRIINNMLAMIVNIGLLLSTQLFDPQLIFAFICGYVGLFGFLTYYNIKQANEVQQEQKLAQAEKEALEDEEYRRQLLETD